MINFSKMNITQIFLQTATDAKVGFIISAIIGYSLYKIIAVINRKKLQSSNDNYNETLNYMVSKIKICIYIYIFL